MINFENKLALVTGASRGIGQAIADTLGELGAVVVGTATTEAGVSAINDRLASKKIPGMGVVMNVTNPDTITTAFTQIREKCKQDPNILVNNAGITQDGLMLRMSQDEWDKVIDTNLTGVFRLTKQCLKAMVKARWGRIINVGSLVGSMGNPGQANYGAAKAGILGFSKSLAQEIAQRGVTVNVVAPGFIETDMTSEFNVEELAQHIPMRKVGSANDIAHAVAFLASDQAGYITGETLHVNGGMYCA